MPRKSREGPTPLPYTLSYASLPFFYLLKDTLYNKPVHVSKIFPQVLWEALIKCTEPEEESRSPLDRNIGDSLLQLESEMGAVCR